MDESENNASEKPATPTGEPKKTIADYKLKPGDRLPGAGRPPNAGRSIKERMNDFVHAQLTWKELNRISRSRAKPAVDVIAAIRLLESMEKPDIADFDEVVNGNKTLKQLRDDGIDTSIVKSINPTKFGVSIEAHDRSRAAAVVMMEHTDGKPSQAVEMSGPAGGPIQTELSAKLSQFDFTAFALALRGETKDA